ncbi:hypothetical protein PG999_001872 [Apiospora kogelbergensis]|uniref:Uncharacterized protein n=1 Tax=Apiospora kogelbergensis TaxID=1337665 RepID=A0AAW0R6J1_9PEZI
MADPGNTSYWPAGWDRERLLNSQATGELDGLSGEQAAAIRAGMVAEIGEPAYQEILAEMGRRKFLADKDEQRKGTQAPTEPPFMETMRLYEARGNQPWDPWGFVVYKSPEILDEAAWKACKQRFAQILDETVDEFRGYPGLDQVMERMRIEWVEDLGVADSGCAAVARIASRDKKLNGGEPMLWSSSPDPGMHHSFCLYITPSSLHSILHSPLPSSVPPRSNERKEVPFVVAVSAQAAVGGEEVSGGQSETGESPWRGFFNIGVESLLTSLFPIVADDMMSPNTIGCHIRGEDVWMDPYRFGVFKPGLGFGTWDGRVRRPGT